MNPCLQKTFVDVVGQDAAHCPLVNVSGEEELVCTAVRTIRPFLHIVILTIEL